MHAVVVTVTINDVEAATRFLREEIVPRISQAPGFVTGYWARIEGGNQGTSMVIFESEDAARQVKEHLQPPPDDTAVLESVEIGEVVANA